MDKYFHLRQYKINKSQFILKMMSREIYSLLILQQLVYQFSAKMSNFEQFMDRLSPFCNDVNRLTRLIRNLDKRLQNIQPGLLAQQKKFQVKLKQLKQKKSTQIPADLKAQYQSIIQKQKQVYGYAKQKEQVAGQLAAAINTSYEMVKIDLKNRIKDKPPQQQNMANTKKKKKPIQNVTKAIQKQQQWTYDYNNPKYCYCGMGSNGEMVGCDNIYCQRQWFHIQCLDEKPVGEQTVWLCRDCKKLSQKYKKHATIKQFI